MTKGAVRCCISKILMILFYSKTKCEPLSWRIRTVKTH
jgi:hypothetical protein